MEDLQEEVLDCLVIAPHLVEVHWVVLGYLHMALHQVVVQLHQDIVAHQVVPHQVGVLMTMAHLRLLQCHPLVAVQDYQVMDPHLAVVQLLLATVLPLEVAQHRLVTVLPLEEAQHLPVMELPLEVALHLPVMVLHLVEAQLLLVIVPLVVVIQHLLATVLHLVVILHLLATVLHQVVAQHLLVIVLHL